MAHTPRLSRRQLLQAALAASVGAPAALRAQPRREPVVVLTAYPDEVVSRFEAAFEKAHPGYRLQVVWRMPHEALPYLRQPGQSGVDVYWSASPRTYAALAGDGLLRKLELDRTDLPRRIGRAQLADEDDRYTATEMAGFGFVVNSAALAARGLPEPADWDDLAQPQYAGLIALPAPSRVGFAPPLLEIVLQAWGWERGWALWSAIVANAELVGRGSTFVTDEVASGRRPIGVSIDFFSVSAIANGAPLKFIYPRHGGINPAHVAITAQAPHPAGARAFVDFVLSPAGQLLLASPDIRKLPVRPSVYRQLPAGYFDSFAAAAKGAFDFDAEAARPRLGLSTAVFAQMFEAAPADVAALWTRVRQREQLGQDATQARQALEKAPLTEAEAADPSLRRLFRERLEGSDAPALNATESRWRINAEWQRALARTALDRAGS